MTVLYVNTGYTSPYALTVFVALKVKGVPFELVALDLEKGEHKRPEFADASGTVRIPMLDHDGFRLTESSAITEYLDEVVSGPRLYPLHPEDRARARQIQAWVRSDLLALRMERGTEHVWHGAKLPALSTDARYAADKLLHFTESVLPYGETMLFGDWSIADTDLGIMLNRLVLAGDELPAHIRTYAETQWAHPAVQGWMTRFKRG